MSIAAISLPIVPAPLASSGLREAPAAAPFLQMLEEVLVQEAVPASLPPPTMPWPLPGQMPPDYLWLPVPLLLQTPRDDRTAKKRPPARKGRQPGRR
jgi:hypothetical protein